MTHDISDEKLRLIAEMDRKIGEFMQKRADVVNKIIYTTATLRAGDAVKIYDQAGVLLGTGTIVQPLFLKRQGIITYRVRRDEGDVFTNEEYRLERID
ncbi:hypothetical protein SAMN05421823_105175 [Catalinimonas alkaloidigena]|uniref:Uncharacterized protein n=1 Tax=Catalinimonas alkaloidigena TaxID=1075417 RepID=A0A1G9J2K4_9BACT|nr:hypothetical protein [Catalinimonas alkaloidigena]SDL31404.1 hypothetical protein SAMN05421823_105175 [Catalinimonas alkaloidigena]